jgi:hypothetical protein
MNPMELAWQYGYGMAVKEAAEKLAVSPEWVRNAVQNIVTAEHALPRASFAGRIGASVYKNPLYQQLDRVKDLSRAAGGSFFGTPIGTGPMAERFGQNRRALMHEARDAMTAMESAHAASKTNVRLRSLHPQAPSAGLVSEVQSKALELPKPLQAPDFDPSEMFQRYA